MSSGGRLAGKVVLITGAARGMGAVNQVGTFPRYEARRPAHGPGRRLVPWERLPVARVGQPEDGANMALFLASDESAYCTGAEFVVDGGMTASSHHRVERAGGG